MQISWVQALPKNETAKCYWGCMDPEPLGAQQPAWLHSPVGGGKTGEQEAMKRFGRGREGKGEGLQLRNCLLALLAD